MLLVLYSTSNCCGSAFNELISEGTFYEYWGIMCTVYCVLCTVYCVVPYSILDTEQLQGESVDSYIDWGELRV